MIQLRIMGENAEEVGSVVNLIKAVFPDLNFSTPRAGSNPKYKDKQKVFSYGRPRVKKGEPVALDLNIEVTRKELPTPPNKPKALK